ncbi:PIN domain-containing protein [Desulfurococcaceae archaeon MEX13E-LK6-19]|nr:PIN domain-containing protein [Desulfurococcaceae archaeon MEX13E-LK6-19]
MAKQVKVLVDTSFLLPALGIDVEEEVYTAIKYFYLMEVYYLEESILEAMWSILKHVKEEDLDNVLEGLKAIRMTYKQAIPPPEAYMDACRLYWEGHNDYIDNLLYATSRRLGLKLLTIDKEFINFLRKKSKPIENIVTPSNLKDLF